MPDQIDLSKMQSVPMMGPYGYLRLYRHWCEPDGAMWDKVWKNTPSNDYWRSALRGQLSSDLERPFLKYLSKGARILEAGCGVGQVVLALRARGFDCYGLDFAKTIIETLNNRFPDIPFDHGDIRSLPYPDNFFDSYISLGVIEHFTNGQDGILNEAARVTKPGGYIFISVPALNGYRKLRCNLKLYASTATEPFFESCLSVLEIKSLLVNSGFSPVEHSYQNTVMTFAQETPIRPLYRLIEDTRYIRGAVDKCLKLLLPKTWFGHMVMIVAQKIK